MTRKFPFILLAGLGAIAATTAVASDLAPAKALGNAYWAGVHWDDDDDDRRTAAPMALPNEAALKKAGMVRVVEVERDDGRIEVEGVDAKGRELEIEMDARGQRILSIERSYL